MEEKKEKILILTLGTGALAEEKETAGRLEKVITKGIAAYRVANYCFETQENQEIIKSEFIAYPLIKTFHPDKIFILGTIKSSWAAFYAKFCDINEKSVRILCEIECNGGKNTSKEKLLEYSKVITQIYQSELNKELFVEGTKVEIILTRYGICEQELLENYELLNQIGKSLKKNVYYEIAFDITHSFRSLPIYNLVILNYFKEVSDFNLQIKHIFYGNLEVCRENNNIAQIVDLADLVEVMELTNGVSEFRNTGNVATLLKIIPEEEKQLKNALEKFDWATQVNAFDKIDETLQELIETVLQPGKNKSKYADLRNMIYQVILQKYFQQNAIHVVGIKDMNELSVAEKQFATSKWYLNQNRYGQALATGLEALRSMLVPFYLELKNIEVTQANCDDENHRKAAIQRLEKIKKVMESSDKNQNDIQRLLGELEQCRMCVVPIRNVFAHNLKSNIKCLCEQCSVAVGDSSNDYCLKQMIQTFILKLEKLYQYLCDNREKVKEIYLREYDELKKENIYGNLQNIRIVISDKKLDDLSYQEFKKTKKKIYQVYRLDDAIMNILKKKKNVVLSAAFYLQYFKELCNENDNVSFILEGSTLTQIMHFVPVFRYIGGNPMMKDGKAIGNLEYEIDWELLERIDLGEDLEKMLSMKLIPC